MSGTYTDINNNVNYTYTVGSGIANVAVSENATGNITILSSFTTGEETYLVTSIIRDAFPFLTLLTSIIIPNSVISIGFYAFQGCTGLTAVTLGSGIEIIQDGVFAGCSALQTVYFQHTGMLPSLDVAALPTAPKPQTAYYKTGATSPTTGSANTYLLTYFNEAIEQLPPPVICFKEDSKILCLKDEMEVYVPIQNIRKGDLVKTFCSGFVPVNMIGTSKVYNPANNLRGMNRLYKCSKENYPELDEDLIITGCHSILVKSLTETQKEQSKELTGKIWVTENHYRLIACTDERAQPYEEEGTFNIWHLALDHGDERMNYGVFANGGLLVETTSKRMLSKYSGMNLVE